MIVEVLNYEDQKQLNEINSFLEGSDYSVIQQYPIIKYLYKEKNQKFYYLFCKDNEKVVGVLPIIVFMSSLGNIIQSSPILGYGGIVSVDTGKEGIYSLLIDEMLKIASDNKCISVTIGTSILDNSLEIYKKVFKPDFIKENFYQYSILDDLPINKLKSKRRCAIKNKINKSRNSNIRIVINEDNYFDEWYNIHCERFNKINAKSLPYNMLKNITKYLINNCHADFYYALLGNKLIGGTLVIYNKNVMDYFISSFATDYMNLNSSEFVLQRIHEDAINRKIKVFNWESSPSKEGGVYEFKKSWGAEENNHYYLTRITGDMRKLKTADIDTIKSIYRGYYVIPYDYLNSIMGGNKA